MLIYLRKVLRKENGAGNEARTRDPDLGKVVLYQLSYSRIGFDKAVLYEYFYPMQAQNWKKVELVEFLISQANKMFAVIK